MSEAVNRTKKKIAILGGSTTNDIKLVLELFLLNYGIEPEFYESEYNQYYEDAMFPPEELLNFNPDFIYICTTFRNIRTLPDMGIADKEIDELFDNEVNKFSSIWNSLRDRFHCVILQNNFEMPFYRLLGNKDASDIHGAVNFVSRLNCEFSRYANEHDDFFIIDINYISADLGLGKWHDLQNWYLYKYSMSLEAIPYLAINVANVIKSLLGKNKKGYVLDLDNTLWGGVIGDDGVDNIEIGPEETVGQAFLEFQNYLKAQKTLGVILNVDSKNDHENAISGLNHPDGALKPDDMIIIKANWEPKDRNFLEIADELQLLPESLVFVDDNPAERHIVREQIPSVNAPEIGNVHNYIQILDRSGYFEVTHYSADDAKRNRMYKENAERKQLESKFSNYKDYLKSLDMKADIKPFEPLFYSRISQLSNKSNQYNLTTRRYLQEEIEQIAKDKGYITLYGKLEDRFGDNGVVSVAIGRIENKVCHIELWIMSCRVLKRDMEYAMMDTFVSACKDRGIKEIRGYYYPTAKNNMVKEFFAMHGYTKLDEDSDGNTKWSLQVNEYISKNEVIDVNS